MEALFLMSKVPVYKTDKTGEILRCKRDTRGGVGVVPGVHDDHGQDTAALGVGQRHSHRVEPLQRATVESE